LGVSAGRFLNSGKSTTTRFPSKLKIRPTLFKHTGLFPEQAVNWDWFSGLIRAAKEKGAR